MVIRCFQCKGLLQVDEKNLPSDRRAKIRCPHCKGIGLMPDISPNRPASEDASAVPKDRQGPDYLSLLPLDRQPRQQSDWKEAAIPQDAFKTFRYPGERQNLEPAKKPALRGWPLWVWVIISVVVVAFFAVLVNIILPGPAGVSPVVHTVPPEQAGSPKVTEEDLRVPRDRSLPGIQDR